MRSIGREELFGLISIRLMCVPTMQPAMIRPTLLRLPGRGPKIWAPAEEYKANKVRRLKVDNIVVQERVRSSTAIWTQIH